MTRGVSCKPDAVDDQKSDAVSVQALETLKVLDFLLSCGDFRFRCRINLFNFFLLFEDDMPGLSKALKFA